MENQEAQSIPIVPPVEPPSGGDVVSGMMARFNAQKEVASAEPVKPAAEAEKPQETVVEAAQAALTSEADPATKLPEKTPRAERIADLRAEAAELKRVQAEVLPAKEKEIADMKARLEELQGVDKSQYEKVIADKEAALAAYEKKVAVYDVRESQHFKKEIIAPMLEIGKSVDRVAASYGADAQALKDAMTIADPKAQRERLTEIMADFDPADQAKIRMLVDKTQDIYDKAAEIEADAVNAKKELEFLESQKAQQTKAEREKTLSATAKAVHQQFLEHLPMIKEDPKLEAEMLSAQVTDDPTMAVYNAMSGKLVAALVTRDRAKDARIKELEGELAARAALSPKAGGGTGQQQQAAQPGLPQGETTWQRWQNYRTSS